MRIHDLVSFLESLAPLSLQEGYDNSGLLTGNASDEVTGIMVSIDATEEVITEAIERNCNFLISHHPTIFSGLKKLTGTTYVERAVIKAIQNNIALYACHTNLDAVKLGVNQKICEKLGLINTKILQPRQGLLHKIVTFCPVADADTVRDAMGKAGAGKIGNYSYCTYTTNGMGTFRAEEGANPHVGRIGDVHTEAEVRIETICDTFRVQAVIKAILDAHPYEEVAYDIIPLANMHSEYGLGMVGEMPEELSEREVLLRIKKVFGGIVRHTKLLDTPIKKIAVCGGSGSFLLKEAINAGAHLFLTSDVKYHQFFDAENRILLADIGHYEGEQFTMHRLCDLISEKFPTFAPLLTKVNTNPVNYL